ncbi:MAG: cell envelope integrity protein CreD [Lentisphaeria bacterium]|nr:cell envelope integrity protein CreD [Lentisphaeria bacterium]
MEEEKSQNLVDAVRRKVRSSVTAKLVVVGIVLLLCQIPVAMISGLRLERMGRASSVESEVASKWGKAQQITGPLLELPVSRQKVVETRKEGPRTVTEHDVLHVSPENIEIKGSLAPEIRYRGIYEVILYRAELTLRGTFSGSRRVPDDGRNWKISGEGGHLTLGVGDIKGITDIAVMIDGKVCRALPGIGVPRKGRSLSGGIDVPLPGTPGGNSGRPLNFEIRLRLNGCRSLLVYPVGRTTRMDLASTWASPSFSGGFLPERRTITPEGFSASWVINEFNRDCPASWIGTGVSFSDDQYAGVDLLKTVNPYALVARAVSYDLLIFIIVLLFLLVAEKLCGSWVHPLQYFVAGLSLVLFYSVLLALSEHISFNASYAVSAAVVAALGGFYARLIFGSLKTALGMFCVMMLSYGVIFVILRLEDYALLAGSGVLVILMAVLMGFTGRLNRRAE